MRKVTLDVDRLCVDSFETTPAPAAERGTVHGFYSQVGTCDGFVGTCRYGGTCGNGCPGTRVCTI